MTDDGTDIELRVDALLADYERCFPSIRQFNFDTLLCYKAERDTKGTWGDHLGTFTYAPPGVANLLVTLPGKASLMFELAEEVAVELKKLDAYR